MNLKNYKSLKVGKIYLHSDSILRGKSQGAFNLTNSDNIFLDIAKDEIQFTKLFYNFLRFRAMRKLLLNLIKNDDFNKYKSKIKYEHFKINDNNSEYGNFDLVIKNEKVDIIFEIKIDNNTSLTDNQPLQYLKYLAEKSNTSFKALILLAPNDYSNIEEYQKILSNFKDPLDIKIFTPIIYWNQLIESFKKEELNKISKLFDEYYKFLNDFFGIIEGTSLNHIDIENLFDKEVPDAISKLMDIMYSVKLKLIEKGYNIEKKQDDVTGRYYKETGHEYGFYIKDSNGNWILFFGIWFDFWKKYNKPLCIALDLYDPKSNQKKTLENKFRKICEEENLDVKFHYEMPTTFIKKDIVMKNNNHEEIANLIEKFCNRFGIMP
jgi:hypothetical protein